jgi:hypothetical protein
MFKRYLTHLSSVIPLFIIINTVFPMLLSAVFKFYPQLQFILITIIIRKQIKILARGI